MHSYLVCLPPPHSRSDTTERAREHFATPISGSAVQLKCLQSSFINSSLTSLYLLLNLHLLLVSTSSGTAKAALTPCRSVRY